MSEQARAEIIAIGNELLLGDVLDTNTNWLCKRITGIGGQVTRAALVRDEHAAIVAEIRSALDRAPDLIVTTGAWVPPETTSPCRPWPKPQHVPSSYMPKH